MCTRLHLEGDLTRQHILQGGSITVFADGSGVPVSGSVSTVQAQTRGWWLVNPTEEDLLYGTQTKAALEHRPVPVRHHRVIRTACGVQRSLRDSESHARTEYHTPYVPWRMSHYFVDKVDVPFGCQASFAQHCTDAAEGTALPNALCA
jgi:hypothetical protein